MFALNSLIPDALSKTPAGPTSARVFPERFPLPRSLSPRSAAATFCLIYSSFVNVLDIFSGSNLGSNGDSRTIILLLPFESVGSIIVLIVCSGASSP